MKSRLIKHAQVLRKNMTDAERLLWSRIRAKQLGVKFRRQQSIEKFIVDFVCFENKLVIEVDGGQHYDSKIDSARDKWLKENGFEVLRFWNNDVLGNIEGVVEVIRREITLPLIPSHQGRGNSRGASRQGRGNSRRNSNKRGRVDVE